MQISGTIIEYFTVFGSGVLVSFTPCVYPLLPLTASFIGGLNTRGAKSHGFVISLFYVLGVAITYCSLGVIAALTGKVFGQFQANPVVYMIVAVVLLFFGLVMMNVIKWPVLVSGFGRKAPPQSIGAVILFGMGSGLVIGPCTAPVLGTMLVYVASKQNLLHAISLLFVFSYGVGASLILVGMFSGLLSRLPKSGVWLVRIQQICGILLLLGAVYFAYQAILFV